MLKTQSETKKYGLNGQNLEQQGCHELAQQEKGQEAREKEAF